MTTDFNELIPKNIVLFSIKDINDLGVIKSDMCKKLIYGQKIEVIKIGSKNFISRTGLIKYLESQTIAAEDSADNGKFSA